MGQTKKRKCTDNVDKIINKQDFDTGLQHFIESKDNKKDVSYLKDLYI